VHHHLLTIIRGPAVHSKTVVVGVMQQVARRAVRLVWSSLDSHLRKRLEACGCFSTKASMLFAPDLNAGAR
jgi:hypothetical protein